MGDYQTIVVHLKPETYDSVIALSVATGHDIEDMVRKLTELGLRQQLSHDIGHGLLTCPWCGSEPVMQPWHGGPESKRLISCDNEECEVSPSVVANTVMLAIRAWNTRCSNK